MGDHPLSPYSGGSRGLRHNLDSHQLPRGSAMNSPPQRTRTFERSVPMPIARTRPEEAPPPLPPPAFVEQISQGNDLGFYHANRGAKLGSMALVPPTSSLATSSLQGQRYQSRRESTDSDSPILQRKDSSSFPVRTIPSLETFNFQHHADEGYGSMSGSSNITNQLQRETALEVKQRQSMSAAYDYAQLSRLGRPKTPTQSTPTIGSLETSPASRRASLQQAGRPHLKNLSLSDRSLSVSSEPPFQVGSPFSKWGSSPQSQSGLVSPGYSNLGAARSPTFDESNATSPGVFPGTSEESDRFGRRSIAQQPRIKRSDSSLSMAMSAMSTSNSGGNNEFGSNIGAAVGGSSGGAGAAGARVSGRGGRVGGSDHHHQNFFSSSSVSEEGDHLEHTGVRYLNLDDHSHSSSSFSHHRQHPPPPPPPPQQQHSHSSSTNSVSAQHPSSSAAASLQSHHHSAAAQPQQPSQSQLPPAFAPHYAHQHPTHIAPQPPPLTLSSHQAANQQPQNYNSTIARNRHRASHSRSGMAPSTRPLEEVDRDDDHGAADDAPNKRRQTEDRRRVSPAPAQTHPSQASYASSASASISNGSYASSAGPSITGSSLTSMSPHSSRLSPSNLPPPNDHSHGRNSPYLSQMSLDSNMRPSNPQSQQPPVPMSSADVQATAAAAHSMATDQSVRQQPPTSNAPQLQASLHICDCCPKKPKKFDTLEELQQHQAEKQYYCQYCHNRFKNKNEAERHQNSLHLRRHSWSCATLDRNYHTAFHPSNAIPPNTSATHAQQQQAQQSQYAEFDVCGYCGEKFPNSPAPDWVVRSQHLTTVHKFGECNQSKKFYRADHFRQHLKHSHGGQSGKWTNMLENACMREEPPLTPDGQSQEQIRMTQQAQTPQQPPQPVSQPQPQQSANEVQIQAQQAAQAAQAAAQAAQAAQAVQAQQRMKQEENQPVLSREQTAALQQSAHGTPVSAPMASMGGYDQGRYQPPGEVQYSTINEERKI